VVSDEGVMVRLQNGAGKDAVIKRVGFSSSALAGNCSTGVIVGFLKAGAVKNFVSADPAACGAVARGVNRYKIEVEYSWLDSYTITHKGVGDLVSRVDVGAELGGGDYGGFGGSLVGYWKFDVDENPTSDSSGNGNDGTVADATWQGSGCQKGGCYYFDGNAYINANNDPSLDTPSTTNQFTIAAWIKPAIIASSKAIVEKGDRLRIYTQSANRFYIMTRFVGDSGGTAVNSISTYQADTWYHVA
jgi:hypothetical protein